MEDSIKWEQAMDDEMRSLEKNDTWVLTELPAGKIFSEQVGVQNQD